MSKVIRFPYESSNSPQYISSIVSLWLSLNKSYKNCLTIDVLPVFEAPRTKMRYEALPSIDPYPKKEYRYVVWPCKDVKKNIRPFFYFFSAYFSGYFFPFLLHKKNRDFSLDFLLGQKYSKNISIFLM